MPPNLAFFSPLVQSLVLIACCGNMITAAPIPHDIVESDLTITGELGSFKSSWEIQRKEVGLVFATLKLASPTAARPPAIEVKWHFSAVDIAGTWVSDYDKANLDHGTNVESRAMMRAPVLMFLGPDDGNRFTVALSDALRPNRLAAGLREEDINITASAKLFTEAQPALTNYQITFRFDTRQLPFQQVLQECSRWWAAQDGYAPAPVPNSARLPLYSTWYSYHQSLDPDAIVAECKLGGELGMAGVIVDDGWQTLDSNRGYAFTGDWKPERIPDFKKFVDRVHALNQKFMLWYSVPMVGVNSQALKRFEGKTLNFSKSLNAYVLDPRYPEVREYLLGTYESAVRDWGIDGLKLDFIELFSPKPDTVLTAENGRDYASVDEAVDRLFSDIMSRLRKINPEIMIEFRQPYNGPLMRKYGNMLRGVDCPNAAQLNRKEIVDLRLLADHTAVHSDMFIWHPDEPVESAALQFLNVIFSVPQISVKLAEVSPAHREMLGFWLGYWKTNRNVLLDGEFQPVSPVQNYPMVISRSPEKLIAAVYQNIVIAPGANPPGQIDVVNAKPGKSVVINFQEVYGRATVITRDCRGKKVSEATSDILPGAHAFDVPPSGLLEIIHSTHP